MIAAAALTGALCALTWIAAGALIARKRIWPQYLRRYYQRKGVPPAEM